MCSTYYTCSFVERSSLFFCPIHHLVHREFLCLRPTIATLHQALLLDDVENPSNAKARSSFNKRIPATTYRSSHLEELRQLALHITPAPS
ncbi:hypothetical protein K443DRAFT_670982 [Laccaria amethystina LaAM-08-1]|uniref:Uncharacterized protein n=1 Tax=Laccaria amethystina LaAM-08-1 TaxID=1095629 RepID=A0A0C9YQN5_9AGAR|nr:hypothetical protein K443DRAFT_670982 [Laccaria amethystina LaAM-08-1]